MEERPKNMPLNPEYMIAYTPGKVGSTSIIDALRTVGVPCHRCTDNNIAQYHRPNWPTITGVREPIAWIFSHVFEGYLARGSHPYPSEAQRIVESIQHGPLHERLMWYCNWLAESYRQTTGVNIYGRRWIKKTGWAIYSIRSLIVRTDMMDDVFAEALNEFIPPYYPDIDMSTLRVEHRAKGKDRFEGYDEFMDAVKFDKLWLAKFYEKTPMCYWFFFVPEMKAWIKKWAKA